MMLQVELGFSLGSFHAFVALYREHNSRDNIKDSVQKYFAKKKNEKKELKSHGTIDENKEV
jgi:hypothetical protein